jgi:5-methylcytosine-specific restriction endonuclease McrA
MLPDDSTVPRPAPSAQQQLDFLAKIERLLAEGRFTSTYKFALLIALTNIAVEQGDDSGDPLDIDLDDVARQYLALYWNMARPYPRIDAILKQNREAAKPSKMITLLKDEARQSQSSYRRLRVYRASRDGLVSETRRTLAKDVLYRLQTVGKTAESEKDRFLYDHPPTAAECARLTHITLKPGATACLRRLRGVIVAMVQSRWALWVRENNEKLAADRQLEEFLFGASRTNVAVYAERFYDMQDGRCFYSGVKLAGPGAGEVDHFIPWSRYPFDSPFNLVLASRKINNSMRDKLKPVEWRSAWLARNEVAFARLTAPEPRGLCAVAADANTAVAISEWIYRTTA